MIVTRFHPCLGCYKMPHSDRHIRTSHLTKLAKITFSKTDKFWVRKTFHFKASHLLQSRNSFKFTSCFDFKTTCYTRNFTSALTLSMFSSAELRNRIEDIKKKNLHFREIDTVIHALGIHFSLEGISTKIIILSEKILQTQEKRQDLEGLRKGSLFRENLLTIFYSLKAIEDHLKIKSVELPPAQEKSIQNLAVLIANAKKLL